MKSEPKPQVINCLGAKVYYWTFNSDKNDTIVMLHGFRGTHHGLQQIVDKLPDFKIIVPDLPAFGHSTPMHDRRHDIEGYAEFAKTFIKSVAPKRPHLLGHSFGSIIAANIAATKPKLINKLLLINPVAELNNNKFDLSIQLGRFYFWLGCKVLPRRAGEALLRNKLVILMGSAFMTKTRDKTLRKSIHKNHVLHFGSFHSRKELNEAYVASVSRSISEYADSITIPTLLVAGKEDVLTPEAGQYRLVARLKNAKLVMLPSVGHLVHYEKPAQAANAIRSFLKDGSDPSA